MDINIGLSVTATGTADAITCTASPAPASLTDKLKYFVTALGANTSTTPSFAPNGLTARTIVKNGGQALVAGDIPRAGYVFIIQYDLANTRWELLNPDSGFTKDGTRIYLDSDGLGARYGIGHKNGAVELTSYIDTGVGAGAWWGTKSNHDFFIFTNDGGVQAIFRTSGTIALPNETAHKLTYFDNDKNLKSAPFNYTDVVQKSNNLSDLANAATARTNLGGVITCAESLDFAHNALNPADSTSYFFAANAATAATSSAILRRKPVGMTGKIYHVGLQITISTSIGTTETATLKINNVTQGTSVTLFTNLQYDLVGRAYVLTLPTPFDVTFGDLLEAQVDMPAFATNPVAVIHYLNVIILAK